MDKIEFISTVKGMTGSEECIPKPAKHFIPKWFKDIPSSHNGTVKQCPSFPDYFSQGYIVPMWADSVLKYEKISATWEWSTPTSTFTWDTHSNDQFINYINPNFKGVDGSFVFKAICPWKVITPPGWSVLQLPLFYHFNKDWSVLPGVIDTDIHHEINQQVLFHSEEKTIEIKKGTPFVLYVPFKRNNNLDLSVREKTDEDQKTFDQSDFRFFSSFTPNGIYRSLQRKRDKNV